MGLVGEGGVRGDLADPAVWQCGDRDPQPPPLPNSDEGDTDRFARQGPQPRRGESGFRGGGAETRPVAAPQDVRQAWIERGRWSERVGDLGVGRRQIPVLGESVENPGFQ